MIYSGLRKWTTCIYTCGLVPGPPHVDYIYIYTVCMYVCRLVCICTLIGPIGSRVYMRVSKYKSREKWGRIEVQKEENDEGIRKVRK